jgi:hypothetical protein
MNPIIEVSRENKIVANKQVNVLKYCTLFDIFVLGFARLILVFINFVPCCFAAV